jgi:branched-chain amino acid aminotransferase
MANLHPYCIINGSLQPRGTAAIGLDDMALNRGYGVFDFFKVMQGIPMHLDAHLQRLFHSAQHMHLPINEEVERWKSLIQQLLDANHVQDAGVKILVTAGYAANGYSIASPNIIITTQSLPAKKEDDYDKGIAVITHEYQREMPDVKSINYTRGIWLLPQIAAAGASDVLYYANDLLSESPRSNVFVVTTAGVLLTPEHNMLKGITRQQVLSIASQHVSVACTDVTITDLRNAAEVFITSTTKGILPVTTIDGMPVGNGQPGKVTLQLMQALEMHEKHL